jgi:membrane-bound serine protease (ClpP class)
VRSARNPWIAAFGLAMLAVAGVTAGTTAPDLAPSAQKVVAVLEVRGAIGPATSRYVERALESAQNRGDPAVILKMDTPGGLDSSMRDIIRAILASRVPVVTYVAPPGARAASAGTYILYASHVAAMAPATNLGAATPVSIGGETPAPPAPAPAPDKGGKSPTDTAANADAAQTPMERKVVNDAVAYIRGLAELRGRNADWAEQAVRGAASLSATAALQNHVIDLIARDVPDLLAQLDGRHVKVGEQTLTLATRNVATLSIEPDWRTRLLSVITNPTVAYGLMLIGIYGLLLEGYNPGAVLPGVVGAISLLLALFAFQILSVNYAGLALVGLGITLIIAEFFLPTFGSLGLGGLVAFVAGSIILLDTDVPGLNIAMPLIAGIAVGGGLILLGLVYVASRSLRRPVVTGAQAMVGAAAEAFEDFSERGRVRFGGEIWNANTSAPVHAGQAVRIVRVDGLTLWVEPAAGARRN